MIRPGWGRCTGRLSATWAFDSSNGTACHRCWRPDQKFLVSTVFLLVFFLYSRFSSISVQLKWASWRLLHLVRYLLLCLVMQFLRADAR
jgi:hypothetical protein